MRKLIVLLILLCISFPLFAQDINLDKYDKKIINNNPKGGNKHEKGHRFSSCSLHGTGSLRLQQQTRRNHVGKENHHHVVYRHRE